ncbi:MAG: hypothetical protein ACYC25_03175 [Paludibacter sp.]
MKKIAIGDLIKFNRKKNDDTKFTLVNNLKKKEVPDVEKEADSGGDYWVSCTSALAYIFKTDDKDFIHEKRNNLLRMIENSTYKVTKDRFQLNIDMLVPFEDFEFNDIKPSTDLQYLKKSDDKSIIQINGLPIYLKPSHVYSFSLSDEHEVGAVWFVAIKGGFTTSELAIFCDVLHRYLHIHYSDHYRINTNYCTVVDVFKTQWINYSQILNNNVISLLEESLEDLKRFL